VPTVSLDDEVGMTVALEVSNINQTITLADGTQAYRLGTRNTATSLQVHDGETNIMTGLIQRARTHTNTGVPGLNELPVVNRLFGLAEDNDTRTEIVLLITPHIVRSVPLPGIGQQEFLSGTDASTGAAPIQLGQPNGLPRQGGAGQPVQAPQPIVNPRGRPAGTTPSFQPPPQVQLPSPPQFAPPSLNAPPAPNATPATPPALVQPGLIPTTPGS
jgi:general secretion pathway protein D